LVDVEIEFLTALIEHLALGGIKSDDITGGKDAIDKVSFEGYDLVVLDLGMCCPDGFETMKKIPKIA
jgi:DNA-binding response OmpR family regulator